MLSQRSQGSYAARALERQQQERAKDGVAPSPDRLLTDRSSYISYLESQLERVSAACMTVQSFDERLEQAVSSIRLLEDKILNLARLVSCTQQFAEAQEAAGREAATDAARRLRSVEARLEALEAEAPGREAAWEAKLRAVSTQAEAKLCEVQAAAEARLGEVASELRGGLEAACHASHVALEKKVGEAAGRLTEVERRVRAVDEYAHSCDVGAAVADVAARVGSVEGSVAHLAKSDGGMKASLGTLQQAVGQLKTAVVALELRPPLGDAAQGSADCLQWLERAREALKREVSDIQQQHGQLAAGLVSAVGAAAAAPASPQKALAAQVLSGLQSSMQHEVGRELRALQLADSLLGSVAAQFKGSPPRAGAAGGATAGALVVAGAENEQTASHAAAAALSKAGAGQGPDANSAAADSWTIPAVPGVAPDSGQQTYPAAPSSQQALAAAADGALAQLQQLAGSRGQLMQAAAAAAAPASGSSSSLRSTFGQMHSMLQSVCQLLQQDEPPGQPSASQPGYRAPTLAFLSRSNTMRGGSPPPGAAPKRTWVPGGSSTAAAAAAAAHGAQGHQLTVRPRSAGPAAAGAGLGRSLSYAAGAGGGGAREALRESVLGQAALAARRRRLQELYSELQQA